jgi:hypothetical protein
MVLVQKERARLAWILIFLLRRLVSLNYRNGNFKWFCCNYVLGEDRLEFEDRDAFIAMELVCAYPMFNRPLFERFRQANGWHRQYFHARGKPLPEDLAVGRRFGWLQRLVELPFDLCWRPRVRRWVEDYYRRRWLKLGVVKDAEDFRQKATDGCIKPDTGSRRKFITDRVARIDPTEQQSGLRTKINLNRALNKNGSTPDILFTHAWLATDLALLRRSHPESPPIDSPDADENEGLSAGALGRFLPGAKLLATHGYRVAFYDPAADRSPVAVFRWVKARLVPMVALYVVEATRDNALRMIELFHSVGSRIFVGGPDANQHPELYLEREADVVLVGDEQGLLLLLDHVHQGSIALEAIPGILFPGKPSHETGPYLDEQRRL